MAQVGSGDARSELPVIAARRNQVSEDFGGDDQHDAVEFVERFLAVQREHEILAGRCGSWSNVQSDKPVATHGDRVFGFVRETRRRCKVCSCAGLRSWYAEEKVWRLVPKVVEVGPMTVTEMYYAACAPTEALGAALGVPEDRPLEAEILHLRRGDLPAAI